MELFTNIINEANYVLWTYVLIIMLLGCASGSVLRLVSYSSVCWVR